MTWSRRVTSQPAGERSLKTALCGHVRDGGVYGSRQDDGGGLIQLTKGRNDGQWNAWPLFTLSLDSRLGGEGLQ